MVLSFFSLLKDWPLFERSTLFFLGVSRQFSGEIIKRSADATGEQDNQYPSNLGAGGSFIVGAVYKHVNPERQKRQPKQYYNPFPSIEPSSKHDFHTVCVAGTFNDWQPEAKPMHPIGDGRWLKETALTPGTYEYCLVVDGQWMPDPLAKETAPNPFGGRNSILKVASSTEAAHLANQKT